MGTSPLQRIAGILTPSRNSRNFGTIPEFWHHPGIPQVMSTNSKIPILEFPEISNVGRGSSVVGRRYCCIRILRYCIHICIYIYICRQRLQLDNVLPRWTSTMGSDCAAFGRARRGRQGQLVTPPVHRFFRCQTSWGAYGSEGLCSTWHKRTGRRDSRSRKI